jgi:hypothetical protein
MEEKWKWRKGRSAGVDAVAVGDGKEALTLFRFSGIKL